MPLNAVLTPPVLFFLLGGAGTLLRSGLEIPLAVSRGLSLYLLMAIGLKGGVELAASGLPPSLLLTLGAAVATSVLGPLVSYQVLRRKLPPADAVAVASTYGSISAVTFITAGGYLALRGVPSSGEMVAAMALMESPAVAVGLLLARRSGVLSVDAAHTGGLRWLIGETFRNEAVFLLLGSLLVGLLVGPAGWEPLRPFAEAPFQGALSVFLLDMGLLAARRLQALRDAGAFPIAYAVAAPVVQALAGMGLAALLGLHRGDALLFTVLCASGSYIAVPAAFRVALPQANPGVYLTMALGVTFPLNVLLGIPLYFEVISRFWP